MKLREVLEIEPGALIKGLHVSFSGSVSLSLLGWQFEQKKFVKGLWSSVDRELFTFNYYKDARVSELLQSGELSAFRLDNMKFAALQKNGRVFFNDSKNWIGCERMPVGACIGMSLGENFVAIQPSSVDMYRSDFYEIYLFHKILHGQNAKWVVLRSKAISKNSVLPEPNLLLYDTFMELA